MKASIEAPEVTPTETVLDEDWPFLDEDKDVCHLMDDSTGTFLCGSQQVTDVYYLVPAHAAIVRGFGDDHVCDQGHKRCWPCVEAWRARPS